MQSILYSQAEKLENNENVKHFRENIDQVVEEFKTNAGTEVDKFKEKHPETYTKISEHVENAKSASTEIMKKIEEIVKSDEVKHLQESTIKFINDVVVILKDGAVGV